MYFPSTVKCSLASFLLLSLSTGVFVASQNNPSHDNPSSALDPVHNSNQKLRSQGGVDVSLIRTCYSCYVMGTDRQCLENRNINCSSGYTCYAYSGYVNSMRYVEKGCMAQVQAEGCYKVVKSEMASDTFVGTRCFCHDYNFCNDMSSASSACAPASLFVLVCLLFAAFYIHG